MKTYPYMDGDRLIELVERRELDAAQLENDRLKVLIARLHRAISARMCADEPTGEERLELSRAWREAGAVLDQPSALLVRPNAAACGQCADKALPDYGEPWTVGRIDRPMEDRHKHDPLMLRDAASRAVSCVNACVGMTDPAAEIAALRRDLGQARGERDRQKVKITAMRDAIEEAETSLTDIAEYWNQDENESAMADACWHAVGTAKKALKKLQPFLTQES